MLELIRPMAEGAAVLIEALGVSLITGFACYVLIFACVQLFKGVDTESIFRKTRQRLGRGILLGLEFLVAADIIHTVAVELTFETVGVLAVVVLIRTFLSFALDVELTGHWPWQDKSKKEEPL